MFKRTFVAAFLLALPIAANAQAPQCRTEASALAGVPPDAKVTAHRGLSAVYFAQAVLDVTGMETGEIDLLTAAAVVAVVHGATLDILFFDATGCQFWVARGPAAGLGEIERAMGVQA